MDIYNECPICFNIFNEINYPCDLISECFECIHVFCINCINKIDHCALCKRKKIGIHKNYTFLKLQIIDTKLLELECKYNRLSEKLISQYISTNNNHKNYINDKLSDDFIQLFNENLKKNNITLKLIKNNIYFVNSLSNCKICIKIIDNYNKLLFEHNRNNNLNHECIIKYDFNVKYLLKLDQGKSSFFTVMKYYSNTLYSLIQQHILKYNVLTMYDVSIILYKIIHAIQYAHSFGYIHGELNINNIVYDNFIYSIKIIGWKYSDNIEYYDDIQSIKNIFIDINKYDSNLLSDEWCTYLCKYTTLSDILNSDYFEPYHSIDIKFE